VTTTDLELFPADPYRAVPPPADDRNSGQKRRDRQALRIAVGLHPLSIDGMKIPLHSDVPRTATKDDDGAYPRCGTCQFRVLLDHHTRRYPKCIVGVPVLIPFSRISSARISHGADTDVRAWWPACRDYEARPEPT
jgi:hypothetical protein